jgi:alkyl sulfatase BDS1-like metallo-beta-lactamase superfamily hydrolase
MTPEMFFDYLSVRLNRVKAAEAKAVLNFDFGDAGKYVLEMGNGVLNHTANRQADNADTTVTLSRSTLNKVILQVVKLDNAVQSGDVKIVGNRAKLDELLSCLDSFDFWFDIVTP